MEKFTVYCYIESATDVPLDGVKPEVLSHAGHDDQEKG